MINKKIKDYIVNKYSKKFYVSFKSEVKDYSLDFDQFKWIPIDYCINWINYQNQYFSEISEIYNDLTFSLSLNKKQVAHIVLGLLKKDNKYYLTSAGLNIRPPLIAENLNDSIRKEINDIFIETVNYIKISCKIDAIYIVSKDYYKNYSTQTIAPKLLQEKYKFEVNFDLYVDLSLGSEKIHNSIRKSYKNLINKYSKNYRVKIENKPEDSLWASFIDFHKKISGKSTRSIATWKLQREFINSGNGFIAYILGEKNEIIAIAQFFISTCEVMYAVGVYERDLKNIPLGHLVQSKVIEYLLTLNKYKYYYVGERNFVSSNSISEKEVNIGLFKQGFSTNLYPKYIFRL